MSIIPAHKYIDNNNIKRALYGNRKYHNLQ